MSNSMINAPSPTPGRPKSGETERETRPAFEPSKPTQVGLEPRLSAPSGGRSRYSSNGGLS